MRVLGRGTAGAGLHAGGSSRAQWQRVASSLSAAYEIVAADLIGFGRSRALSWI